MGFFRANQMLHPSTSSENGFPRPRWSWWSLRVFSSKKKAVSREKVECRAFNRDPYDGLLWSPYNWVVLSPIKLYTPNNQGFFHCSIPDGSINSWWFLRVSLKTSVHFTGVFLNGTPPKTDMTIEKQCMNEDVSPMKMLIFYCYVNFLEGTPL